MKLRIIKMLWMRTGERTFIKQLCKRIPKCPTNSCFITPHCCTDWGSSLGEIFITRPFFVPRSLSSTESLRQLSEQLNGLVSQVWPCFGPFVLIIFLVSDVELSAASSRKSSSMLEMSTAILLNNEIFKHGEAKPPVLGM